ncbi:hypothetical protein ACFQAS_05560 [Halopenitus salinus]|uniref:Rhomboid family intramembrane serine protease n=1 Tax=Halopenitus salinus TaxID=1198295 RepID=A0ABD5UWU9_9EURY
MSEDPSLREVAAEIRTAVGQAVRSISAIEFAIVYLAVPGILTGLYLLPGTDAWSLSLGAESLLSNRWTLWTAFASSYVHTHPGHLLNNVAAYLMVMGVAYPLSMLAGWRRRLPSIAVCCLFVVPFASAWTSLVTLGAITDVPSSGFSDVNAGFLGYLLVVWFAAAERLTAGAVDRRLAFVAAPASVGAVLAAPETVAYFPPLRGVAAACLAFAAVIAVVLVRAGAVPRRVALDPVPEFVLVVGASVLLAGLLGSMVIVPMGSNAWAHLAGYVVGLAVSLALVGLSGSCSDPVSP